MLSLQYYYLYSYSPTASAAWPENYKTKQSMNILETDEEHVKIDTADKKSAR